MFLVLCQGRMAVKAVKILYNLSKMMYNKCHNRGILLHQSEKDKTVQMTYKEQLNEYLSAIKNGDETKYRDLMQISFGPLMHVAKSYLINKSDADDVLSDVYWRIYRYADRYDTSKDAQAYLWQIVKNRAFDYNKRRLKSKTVNLDDIQIFDNVDAFAGAEAKMDLVKALKNIGHTNTMIVVWTYREGLTQEEIGQRLDISKSAVCQRLGKIKEKLSEYFKKF